MNIIDELMSKLRNAVGDDLISLDVWNDSKNQLLNNKPVSYATHEFMHSILNLAYTSMRKGDERAARVYLEHVAIEMGLIKW